MPVDCWYLHRWREQCPYLDILIVKGVVVELTPEEEYFYSTVSMEVLCDVAEEIATQLGGKYIALARAAQSKEESEEWRRRMYEVDDTRGSLSPDDRQPLIDHIVLWKAEIARLRGRQ